MNLLIFAIFGNTSCLGIHMDICIFCYQLKDGEENFGNYRNIQHKTLECLYPPALSLSSLTLSSRKLIQRSLLFT